jgi:hypothetical protein
VIRRARILWMTSHTSQPRRAMGLLLALTASVLEPCHSPSIPSPKIRSFAWQGAEDDADHRRLWLTHSLLLLPETWQASRYSSTAVRLHQRPYRDALQTSVYLERQFSHIFPVLPSVTRFGATPAPCGTARLCFDLTGALRVSAFRKSFLRRPQKRKRFSEPSEKDAAWHLGAGHLASLRARVSRGQSGQIQTGEKQWHSTRTKSL